MVTDQMIHRIKNPDLMKYPSVIETSHPDQWSTIGDLHGNPVKLLYFMIAMGAVKMEPQDYEAYAKLYIAYRPADEYTDKEGYSKYVENSTYQKMNALLAKMTVVPGARIREDGDDFCDRGIDDTSMFSVITAFKNGGGIFESIASNHGEMLILKMENALNMSTIDGAIDDDKFIKAFISNDDMPNLREHYEFFCSIAGLQYSLAARIITPKQLIDTYTSYLQTMKILSYDYPEEADGEPVIYSHAGISKDDILQQIYNMRADMLPAEKQHYKKVNKIAPRLRKDSDMIPLIDAINRILQIKAEAQDISSLLIDEKIEGDDQDTHLTKVLFNSRGDRKDNNIRNTHGHTHITFGKRITLDSLCGLPNMTGDGFVRRSHDSEHHCDLTYTKTYATPEAALRAKAAKGTENGDSFNADNNAQRKKVKLK